MTTGAPALGKFVLCTFLWLPPCFAAWYYSAPYHTVVTGGLARILVDQVRPGIVSAVERSGSDLAFVTTLEVHPAPGQAAVLVPEVSPLVYTYGLALFLALMLAARASSWKILVGAIVLLPFQAWGIAFDFLAQVGGRLGPEVAAQAGLSGWWLEGVALGYQVGSLIFPSLVPVLLWAAFSRQAIEGIVPIRVRQRTDVASGAH
jgi:hypothetical protein